MKANKQKITKSYVFFNREYLSRIHIQKNGEEAIRIIVYILDRASLHITKTISPGFSKRSFETIVAIYLQKLYLVED